MPDETTGLILKHLEDDKWVPAELFGLPSGCEYQILMPDGGDHHMAIICRFPPGYLEPEHTHTDTVHWGRGGEEERAVPHPRSGVAITTHSRQRPPRPVLLPRRALRCSAPSWDPSILHEYQPEAAEIDPGLIEGDQQKMSEALSPDPTRRPPDERRGRRRRPRAAGGDRGDRPGQGALLQGV